MPATKEQTALQIDTSLPQVQMVDNNNQIMEQSSRNVELDTNSTADLYSPRDQIRQSLYTVDRPSENQKTPANFNEEVAKQSAINLPV